MSSDNIQRQMEFILEHQARFSADIEQLKEAQKRQSDNIDKLSADVQALTGNIDRLSADVQALTGNVNAMQVEMREGFENLIVANEVTRKLAEDVARLAVQTAQRVTNLEDKHNGRG
jgi:uncharacterized coiled-coil protein SlyX